MPRSFHLVCPPAACAYVRQGGGGGYHPVAPDPDRAPDFPLLAPAADGDDGHAVEGGCLFGRKQAGHQ